MTNEPVYFSIDNWGNLRKLSKFLKIMETARVMSKLEGKFNILQGSYNGVPELSFSCHRKDFEDYVVRYGWVVNQTCVLVVREDNTAYLEYPSSTMELGIFTNVSEAEAKMSTGWTYNPEDRTWWTTR